MAIFFISIGLQLDPVLMWEGLPLAIMVAAIFIIGKLTSVYVGCSAANFKSRSSFMIATSMLAMGEFTFVVAKVALDGELIGTDIYSVSDRRSGHHNGPAPVYFPFLSPYLRLDCQQDVEQDEGPPDQNGDDPA